ncbi:MAG TPA: hypothetical protein IGS52_04185 [Oscillatoriaceae cyanobacterium M33_DOE_052]|nr:hypothetical protein [Oscillatoriaceae cyanobacterium M33_DOE_052]
MSRQLGIHLVQGNHGAIALQIQKSSRIDAEAIDQLPLLGTGEDASAMPAGRSN